jgi:nucleoside-diphosphate-sugar epimerase
MKTALVCGAGGFIGGHLVRRLRQDGLWVRGVDQKPLEFAPSEADEFVVGDLRDSDFCRDVFDQRFDEVFQLAADMGGIEYTHARVYDAAIMHNSTRINLNVLDNVRRKEIKRVFFSSSACIYPDYNQQDPEKPNCAEDTAYPAAPDSEYGWEKLYAERLYLVHGRCYGIEPRIARFHNVFGPEGPWQGGREKAPAALCRKIAETRDGGTIDIIGEGKQSRTFLFVSECVEGTLRLMRSDVIGPLNIGSDELITIDTLADMIMDIAGKKLRKRYIPGPVGVRGRSSDNRLIRQKLDWAPSQPVRIGLELTYRWIEEQALRGQSR